MATTASTCSYSAHVVVVEQKKARSNATQTNDNERRPTTEGQSQKQAAAHSLPHSTIQTVSNSPTHHCNTMMKTTLFAVLAGSAAAFAPATNKASTSSALKATFENEPGALPPLGYWDPLNLATSQETFDNFRACELKHGRVAQLAVLGYVVPEFFRFNYDMDLSGLNTQDIPNGIAALYTIPLAGLAQIIFFIGFIERDGLLGDFEIGKPDLDPEVLFKRQTQELQNGRLAMLASMELLRHDWQNYNVPGFDGMDNLITGLPFLYN